MIRDSKSNPQAPNLKGRKSQGKRLEFGDWNLRLENCNLL